jgi:hypothetical protein
MQHNAVKSGTNVQTLRRTAMTAPSGIQSKPRKQQEEWWSHCDPPKRGLTFIRPHGVTPQTTVLSTKYRFKEALTNKHYHGIKMTTDEDRETTVGRFAYRPASATFYLTSPARQNYYFIVHRWAKYEFRMVYRRTLTSLARHNYDL